MRIAIVLVLSALVVTGSTAIARAQPKASDDTSWLNFGPKKSKLPARVTHVSQTGGSKSPSVVTKMNNGTKRLVDNTRHIFSPKKKAPVKQTGTTGVYSMHPKQEEPGFFHKLFYPEPPPPPKTINEWMSLKQVHP